jgi:hypothetical protein
MLYLVNLDGIEGSFWFYRAIRDELGWSFFPGFIKTPNLVSVRNICETYCSISTVIPSAL